MSTFYEQGKYRGEITSQGFNKAQTGTAQFVLKFKVLSHANGDDVPEQYERTIYRAITDKTMQYFKKDLDALGFAGTSLRQLEPGTANFVDLTGNEVLFNCSYELAPDGGTREKWSVAWLSQAGTPIEGESVDAATFRKLDALFGASKREPAKAPQPAAARPASRRVVANRDDELLEREMTTVTDEDIPF